MILSTANFPVPIAIVVALSTTTRAIGQSNRLLWHIPDDLRRFKEKTLGKPVIMGRKTFESILSMNGRPLPNRQNIVLSHQSNYMIDGVETATSLEAALEKARAHKPEEIHIGGGEPLYRQALPFVDRLFLTYVDDDCEGDAFFPEIDGDFVETKRHGVRIHNGLTYEFVDYERR